MNVFINFRASSCDSSNLELNRYLKCMMSLSALVSWPDAEAPLLILLISSPRDMASSKSMSVDCLGYAFLKYSVLRPYCRIILKAEKAAFLILNVVF